MRGSEQDRGSHSFLPARPGLLPAPPGAPAWPQRALVF